MTMQKIIFSLVLLGLLMANSLAETGEIACTKTASFMAPADSPAHRKYAPEYEVRVLHLALDVTPNFDQRTIAGQATLQFKPIARPVQELELDAVDLRVESVDSTEPIQGYQVTEKKIVVTFAAAIPPGKTAGLTIHYHAEPTQGLYFRTPEMGYKAGDTHLFSQGESIMARYWYPCLDEPNAMFTSEITCRVPDGMTVVSNGRLVDQTKDPTTGLTAFHWSQEQVHANYLITLVAGYFKKIEDKYKEIPLTFYTPPSEIGEAMSSFRDTKDMMAFFESEIGVAYPWPKYDQICVNDFVAGGMENTSATTLTDGTLFTDATENIHSSEGLISHELSHQWFGDLVTCKDWSHIWLNEGFATYYETLYAGHKHGRDALLYELYQRTQHITGLADDTEAIVRRTYDSPDQMFGYLAYPKGGWVLHMLRCDLGEDLYRRCIKTYLERYRHANVVTENLRAVIEELSGRSYDQFFDQWVYHAHHPELDVNWSWDERTKLAKVSIRQTQKLSANVLLFNFPFTVRFQGKFGMTDRIIRVQNKEEDFYFRLDSAPDVVRLDPNYALFAKVTFPVPAPMLYAQLANPNDLLGRLLAIEQLARKNDKETIAKLKNTLNNDGFYGVRLEASKALRSIHTEDALEALAASAQQADARVRRQVVADLGGFYRDTAYSVCRKTLDQEKNPAILAAAIRNQSAYAKPEVAEILNRFLISNSFRNELADAAVNAMRSQDDPVYIQPLLATLGKREADFTSRGLAQGLGALAYLARNAENKEPVREFLLRYVNDKRRTVQLAALRACGTLGDPKAIAVVATFAGAGKETPEQGAAKQALTELRAARKPVDDFKNLRQEVLDLQKANRDLRKDFDDFKKVMTTKESAQIPAKKKAPVSASKGR